MNEPSVLDYVKSKLAFWKHSSIEIPRPELPAADTASSGAPAADELDQAATQVGARIYDLPDWLSETDQVSGVEDPVGHSELVYTTSAQPLRAALEPIQTRAAARPQAIEQASSSTLVFALASLALALLAQGFLEPPNRSIFVAAFLYVIAAFVWGFAFVRDRLFSTPVEADAAAGGEHTLRVHPEGLIIGMILMVLAFLTFSLQNGQEVPVFGFLNTAFWLLSIGYLVYGFYNVENTDIFGLRQRARRFFTAPGWKITLTRWSVLLLVVVGVCLFYRFYRLDTVPYDPVSDHAEKLLDVADVLDGQFRVFFPRNTGREAFQFFWTALVAKVFNTGITFFSLKLGTTLIGLLTLYYVYRLGVEIGNRWVGLFAVLFCGFSYWANIQSRIGLRFPLYPGFYAPMLFYLLRGLKRGNRNDFIWAGIWMGIGLQGYTSYRIVPFVAVAAFILYVVHHVTKESRQFALVGLVILGLVSLAVFMPLFRFTLQNPDMVLFRSLTRMSSVERPLPGSPLGILLSNTWAALVMFFWDNGDVWVHSIPHRPALDVISAALFFLGVVLVIVRYARRRSWVDLFMLVSIPMLLLSSILSLAFPNENPNLNRTAAAYVPVFLILGIGMDALVSAVRRSLPGRSGMVFATILGLFLILVSARTNFNLVFNQYDKTVRGSGWNTPEMGQVIRDFVRIGGSADTAFTLAYPYWVDTRLVGMAAGFPRRDTAITPDQLPATINDPRMKLFIVNMEDKPGMAELQKDYPEGRYWEYQSNTQGRDFLVFFVPPKVDMLPPGELPTSP